jgi:lysozyme family protein
MANVDDAIQALLIAEDSTLSAKVVDLGDGAGLTRLGISSRLHPKLVAAKFFDPKVSKNMALPVAVQTYWSEYAIPLMLEKIADQRIATALLSIAVNTGIGTGVKMMQTACVALKQPATIDGLMGPGTLRAIDALPAGELLDEYLYEARAHYFDLAVKNPDDKRFLQGWLNRTNSLAKAA